MSLADGGNYSCQPASLPRASTTLHVLKVIIIILMANVDIVVQTEKKQKIVEKPLTTSGVPDQTKTSAFLLIASLLSLST